MRRPTAAHKPQVDLKYTGTNRNGRLIRPGTIRALKTSRRMKSASTSPTAQAKVRISTVPCASVVPLQLSPASATLPLESVFVGFAARRTVAAPRLPEQDPE